MFNASRRGSNIATAGKLGSSHLADAYAIVSTYSPNAGDIAQEGLKAKAAKQIADTKYNAQINYNNQTTEAQLEGMDEYNKAAQKAKGQNRMAGMLAGLGALTYYATKPQIKPPKPVERKSFDYSDQISALTEQLNSNAAYINKLKSGDAETTESKESASGTSVSTIKPIGSASPAPTPTVPTSSTSQSSNVPKNFNVGGGWKPFGSLIKYAEGTLKKGDKAYNTGFGYRMFDDLSKHPDINFGGVSTAAGAYQFLTPTWNEAAAKLKLTDFGPESQERAGEFLANRRGIDTSKPFTTRAELIQAMDKAAPEWASIPLSSTGRSYYDGDGINSAKASDDLISFYERTVGYKLQ